MKNHDQVISLLLGGATIRQVAEKLAVPKTTVAWVRRRLMEQGEQFTNAPMGRAKDMDKRDQITDLIFEGVSMRDIAAEMEVSKRHVQRIRRELKEQGEDIPSAPTGRKPNPPRLGLQRNAEKYDRIIAHLRRGVPMSDIVATMDVSLPTVSKLRRQLIEQGEQLPDPPPLGIQRNAEKYNRIVTSLRNGVRVSDIVESTGVSYPTILKIRRQLLDRGGQPGPGNPTPLAEPVVEPIAEVSRRPVGQVGGWYCTSAGCSWWGATIDEYREHKKQAHGSLL